MYVQDYSERSAMTNFIQFEMVHTGKGLFDATM